MKKCILLFSYLFLCATIRAQIIDSLAFCVNQVQITRNEGYSRVAIPSLYNTTEAGCPELPCMILRYLLPFNQEISSITILDSTLQLIANDILVYPTQPDYPIDDTTAHPFVQPDGVIYNSNAPYPICAVQCAEQYYEKGYHLALIKVCPIR